MSRIYKTSSGDALDAICFAHYGNEYAVLAVLNANRGLCNYPAVLPPGVDILLPDIEEPSESVDIIRLWD